MIGNASVVRVRPTGKDQYDDTIAGTPGRLTIEPAAVYPRTSANVEERGRSGVVVGLTLLAPVDADILDGDQVEVDGVLYDLDGEAGAWKSPLTGWQPGVEAALKRAAG